MRSSLEDLIDLSCTYFVSKKNSVIKEVKFARRGGHTWQIKRYSVCHIRLLLKGSMDDRRMLIMLISQVPPLQLAEKLALTNADGIQSCRKSYYLYTPPFCSLMSTNQY